MPRIKKYCEQDVIEKATVLFWKHGYQATSMQMLEKAMGINKFSIYASFKNKEGVFLACIKAYKEKSKEMFQRFHNGNQGVADIKQLFYDSMCTWYQNDEKKGCFVTQSYQEFAETEAIFKNEIWDREGIKELFRIKLAKDPQKDEETLNKQVNFLILSLQSLGTITKVSCPNEVKDYIEMVFNRI
ncbi:AcrR family transcriptional regulator [Wenyingzhuangia heitensis]|uniref:AcrR family transcriptional regulator n=1 Tax=Wenyingzhuangia heitensis TaxID=1487859 RepID=A0ABX0U846_9FLAO|nr:TetR/AcrR family transcriptional regulator [Wenyingzhuangia heitensis]NIJ45014.1 AcrR family transcriptional regulator [Wenyingzhuangia heitensis]